MSQIKEIDLLGINLEKSDQKSYRFNIEPLLPGYGQTIGNTFRRVLLSSLKGSAITAVRINNETHEFSTIPGVKEDGVEIILNLKGVRIASNSDEPVTISLECKGAKTIYAGDFKTPAGTEIINKDQIIAILDKGAVLKIEARVETGRGYLPTERMSKENIPLGMILIDAIFTPIRKINYHVSNTRVGQLTNFDKLSIDIETDGTITSLQAMESASQIISQYVEKISQNLSQIKDLETGVPAKKTKPEKKPKKAVDDQD